MTATISASPVPVAPEDRRARIAVALLFLTNGAVPANLIPRYPAIVASLEPTNAEFGLAVAAGPLGALSSGLLAGMLIRRFRSSRVAVACMVASSVCVLLAGVSPMLVLLGAALFMVGALDSVADVAQNSHGLRVQRRYGRSILNSFHAIWSVGAMLGGLMGGAAAGLGIPPGLHLAASALVFSLVNLLCYRFLLAGPEPTRVEGEAAVQDEAASGTRAAARLGTYAILLALGMIAVSGSLVEDSGGTWAALYLSGSLGAAPTVAALGFVALAGMQFVGRIIGDGLVDRFGQRAVARVGGATTALGMGLALVFPTIGGTIIGFGLAGLGIATLAPAAMHTADQLPGLRSGSGLTMLSWLMRLGFLLSPPVVGLVADATALRYGLVVVPLAGLVAVVLSGFLPTRSTPEARRS
ncbi:MFS transporter [Nocardiopsis ansamitocini]|uniref:MFS transporter n=1 Tax=Nocardiopsis ansamitocini TaxID=1670832 RepID=A0A9W6P8V0_9ACTN|nr:MFS transporter [Nocardiopsis ansamitocini]GLU49179.1 MFS transporter [Nocardiopsis ansamitocini]